MDSSWAQSLLPLVARGNSIISEICRLADYIPQVFFMDAKNVKFKRYLEVITDFNYFATSDYFENKIESKAELQDLDEEFRENHMQILDRFYRAFESVHKYIMDLNQFLSSLEDGLFVHHSLVSVMLDEDGKQLMCEALYLYGVMLLLVDKKIDGLVRERMLVSFYRYSVRNSNMDTNTDDVCKLLRSTGFSSAGGKRPSGYPEDYFSRVPIPPAYVSMVVDKLCSDDLYQQLRAFPFPEHRSHARATQATMIYVCLFFAPHILHNETAKMREIVDKHFPDNWVVSVHLGNVVNLLDAWTPYKAASHALANTVEVPLVKQLSAKYVGKVTTCRQAVLRFLKEGVLEANYVLDNIPKLMDIVRDCNVTIRWLILHSAPLDAQMELQKKCKQMRDIVVTTPGFRWEAVLHLLIITAQYEFQLGEMLNEILKKREESWANCKKEGVERMQELSDVFSGTKALTRIEKNDKLQKWCTNLGQQIANLDISNITAAGRKLDQLVKALLEVLEFHQLANNVMVKKFIEDTCGYLQQMLRIINLQDDVLMNLSICADISYAINLMNRFTGFLQSEIAKDPYLVIKLRATFLKLAASHELPLVRLNQCESKDLLSVSQYYSSELVSYVRQVLQVIPQTMFVKLASIVKLQTHEILQLPLRVDKDKLKEFAQLEARNQVAELTHDIAVFTEGILMMKTTLVGVIEVDPHKLLEDGIRKELVNRVSRVLHDGLIFSAKPKPNELVDKLKLLGESMEAFRRSFEYIQDYLNMHGLRLWQEELAKIIRFNVEQECNQWRRIKVQEWQSEFQSRDIPIPKYPSVDRHLTFMGRLLGELLRLSDPKTSIYIETTLTWYDAKTKKEVLYMRVFDMLMMALDTFGLSGLDKMLGFMIVRKIQEMLAYIRSAAVHEDRRVMDLLGNFVKAIKPVAGVTNPKIFGETSTKMKTQLGILTDALMEIGRLQLLRQMVASRLSMSCRFESKFLCTALQACNAATLQDIRRHVLFPTERPYPGGDPTKERAASKDFLSQLGQLLSVTGLHEPMMQVYITTKQVAYISLLLCLALTGCWGRLTFVKSVGALIAKKPGVIDSVDGAPLLFGVVTVMRQLHESACHEFLVLCGQFVRSSLVNVPTGTKASQYPMEVMHCLGFLHDFAFHYRLPERSLNNFIPDYILAEYYSHAQAEI